MDSLVSYPAFQFCNFVRVKFDNNLNGGIITAHVCGNYVCLTSADTVRRVFCRFSYLMQEDTSSHPVVVPRFCAHMGENQGENAEMAR